MSYEPTHPGEDVIPGWLYDELSRVAAEMYRPTVLQLEVLHSEPERPQDGMIAFADGTDWNPGTGAGVYARISGAWSKL